MNKQAGVTINGPARAAKTVAPTYDYTVIEETPERVVLNVKVPARGRYWLLIFPLVCLWIFGGGALLYGLSERSINALMWGAGLCAAAMLMVRYIKRPKTVRVAVDARTIAINGKSYDLAHVRMIRLDLANGFENAYTGYGNHITLMYGSHPVLIATVQDAANARMIHDKIAAVLKGFGWTFGENVKL